MSNYFNKLNFRNKLIQLRKCRFMKKNEFSDANNFLKNKKIVIIGCGSQGLNQGLNMRDSGLDISFALREESISEKKNSWKNAKKNNFKIGTYKEIIPQADLVINLTPDKQHSFVVKKIQKLMKYESCLGYSHGFNIVEIGEKIRKDITVIMVAPKCPGTEVREEYIRGFGVPTLIAVHQENDIKKEGIKIAKAWATAIGSHKAGVLESSFIAEVKSDLMGEQTILCGLLQTGSLLFFDKLVKEGINKEYAAKLIQFGWETITESLKHGGITLMMDRLSNSAKILAFDLSKKLKTILSPLFKKHMDDIMSGVFSLNMIEDWKNNDKQLLIWRKQTKETDFENTEKSSVKISEQEYFDKGIFMVSLIKAGIELSFEIMVNAGILEESAYYESLHELPLIANTIARNRLYAMNLIISDTAEYGNYLFSNSAMLLLKNFINQLKYENLESSSKSNKFVNNLKLLEINNNIRSHPIEKIGIKLRNYMKSMKSLQSLNY